MPNVYGKYFEERQTPHLFVFITAPAGSGKGKLKWSRYFGQAIHEYKRSEYEKEKIFYEQDLANYEAMDKKNRATIEKPFEPANQMFFIPANSSASAMIQAIKDNKLQGIIFETEADTLAGTLKQEWGNFSDLLRKAFHHENISLFRRKDNEYIELNDPHLALVLSGTPKQVHSLMPDVENGLFSRFLFYAFEDDSPFQNPFATDMPYIYEDFFKDKGQQIFSIYENLLNQSYPIEFQFTKEQARIFTEEFNKLFQRNKRLLGDDFTANSRRLGLITFRIAMILTTLRSFEDDLPTSTIICSDLDFNISMQLAITLEQHTIAVYRYLPSTKLQGIKEKFYQLLPDKFNRQDYLRVAQTHEIKEKAAEKYISHFKDNNLLHHDHNCYTKPA